MEDRGINLEEIRREREKESSGCLIRSLESITGTHATEEEWGWRLNDIQKDEQYLGWYDWIKQGGSYRDWLLAATKAEMESIMSFVARLTSHDTPMGTALRKMSLDCDENIDVDSLRTMVREGKQVMVLSFVVSEGAGGNDVIEYHASHLGLAENGGFVSLSDNSAAVNPKGMMKCLVFSNADLEEKKV